MDTYTILEWIVGIGLIGGAITCVTSDKLLTAVIRLSLVSMLAVIAFALMASPDVAITEAVIGSGLVTFVFIIAIKQTFKGETKHEKDR
ncbi:MULTISPECIES: hydrogenase subunit MbhD domain-containing protein [unclassified Fusibacter]|uniref:Na(+)/H(+) antiporter subunit B n=1 Tax=unclassified Fusibacter TaxID=2624464 RepID=UPI0010117E4B|nr:hydrogenase subunit MbhD domain-containing protein [Fusibacter sp. A1]MCK8060061.1 DUF4040 domain-containing protein [Fusibacter sp. A2]NPE22203.1 DUF4040 domain-containing protein [Fusibacter sp. A1]RXV60979.1 DUF4040 domain-containing protein [Fusibacter sp. A1]